MGTNINAVRRLRLGLANQQVEFVDRDLALRRIEEWVDRGVAFPQVIYGPEGCGKTAWLMQSAELLRELGLEVIYVNPLESAFTVELGITDLRNELMNLIREAINQFTWGKVLWSIIGIARSAIEAGTRRLAIIVDDAFQAIGLDKAAMYVKGMLGILEHPPASYDRVIAIAATSEGISLGEIGRHLWADLIPMWNMAKEGLRQLYDQLPEPKPDFEEVWKLTGGNPRILGKLYEKGWAADEVVNELIRAKEITPNFVRKWANHLREAIKDPDHLWHEAPEELTNELIRRNLIMRFLPDRDPRYWIDEPPPEGDPELGIGKYVAWQSPLHREAVRKALGRA